MNDASSEEHFYKRHGTTLNEGEGFIDAAACFGQSTPTTPIACPDHG